ncbi:hypothetical protein PTSG_05464 [Salpingoeca rosetta]|uniref:CYRIA/CYRIB Rac1 binding domain-containing protein n=1 Tax=Salpingoeca rosetta (strain ATCC 50818 / BSB-021) TaxID=946362 RepID=F2UBA5_SALR5|nr:uncharacterized protein PTSG_05464 [Salpingoeca rosetta]EGD73771.1 hypothetical protein PTSG_05464 [Salpingoeca rosetta]|eukprot:XP_004993334.1 hypothetical protein PTSG_05464 [Salpingoeca rosetta]
MAENGMAMLRNKFAEKLTILNDHGKGILCKLYHTKRLLQHEQPPSVLIEKTFESQVKAALKKFPNVDSLKERDSFTSARREELMNTLQPHYYNLVDAMDFQDRVKEVVASMSACQMRLQLNLNYRLTALFLDLLHTYVAVILLLFRLDSRRMIAMVFNATYSMFKGNMEPAYPRLSQLLLDYDTPARVMYAPFKPHINMILTPLMSVRAHLDTMYQTADEFRKAHLLNIANNPAKMTEPEHMYDVLPFTTSTDRMIHWLVFGYLLIPNALAEDESMMTMLRCLGDGFVLQLYRTEVAYPHTLLDTTLASLADAKKMSKQKAQVAEQLAAAITEAPTLHRDRRTYLRHSLAQLLALVQDKPGLLGPKMPVVLRGLVMARDEVNWLMRHAHAQPPKAKAKVNPKVFQDKDLSELLFYITEFNYLLKGQRAIISRYFKDFLTGHNLTVIRETIGALHLSEHEHKILNGFAQTLEALASGEGASFAGFRLDWLRLQASMCAANVPFPLHQNELFASYLNLAEFNSYLLDNADTFVRETSMPANMWFYRTTLTKMFDTCVNSPAHQRFSLAFVMLCDSFSFNATPFFPDERMQIGRGAAEMAANFLARIAYNTTLAVHEMAMAHVALGAELLPSKAVTVMVARTKKGKAPVSKDADRDPETTKKLENLQATLADLCWALNHHVTVNVFNICFSPREYLVKNLSSTVPNALSHLVTMNAPDGVPQRPSVCLSAVKSYMAAYRSLESYVSIDVSSIFANAMLDQTLVAAGSEKPTIATSYVSFYCDLLFKYGGSGAVLFSESRKCLVSKSGVNVRAELYTDVTELRALCSLIGPFGVKQLNADLVSRLGHLLKDMKAIATTNPRINELAQCIHNASDTTDVLRSLKDVDLFFKLLSISGLILNFRKLVLEALSSVLEDRIPFIFTTIQDLHQHVRGSESVNLLALTAGLSSELDPTLIRELRPYIDDPQHVHMLVLLFGVTLRHIGTSSSLAFKPAQGTFEGNSQCIATAAAVLSSILMALSSNPSVMRQSIVQAQKLIIKIGSVLLLRLQKEGGKNRNTALLVLNKIVEESPFLTADVLEEFLPYSLVRCAQHALCAGTSHQQVVPEETA